VTSTSVDAELLARRLSSSSTRSTAARTVASMSRFVSVQTSESVCFCIVSSSDAFCSAVKAALCGEPSPELVPELPCACRLSCLLLSFASFMCAAAMPIALPTADAPSPSLCPPSTISSMARPSPSPLSLPMTLCVCRT
jgi:hypothetical protein